MALAVPEASKIHRRSSAARALPSFHRTKTQNGHECTYVSVMCSPIVFAYQGTRHDAEELGLWGPMLAPNPQARVSAAMLCLALFCSWMTALLLALTKASRMDGECDECF